MRMLSVATSELVALNIRRMVKTNVLALAVFASLYLVLSWIIFRLERVLGDMLIPTLFLPALVAVVFTLATLRMAMRPIATISVVDGGLRGAAKAKEFTIPWQEIRNAIVFRRDSRIETLVINTSMAVPLPGPNSGNLDAIALALRSSQVPCEEFDAKSWRDTLKLGMKGGMQFGISVFLLMLAFLALSNYGAKLMALWRD